MLSLIGLMWQFLVFPQIKTNFFLFLSEARWCKLNDILIFLLYNFKWVSIGYVMQEVKKDILDEHLTQKDIVQLLFHNAQHMVTREELKSDIKELKDDLKQDILRVEDRMSKVDDRISKVSDKFDKVQWLLVATLLAVIFKDYIISIVQ